MPKITTYNTGNSIKDMGNFSKDTRFNENIAGQVDLLKKINSDILLLQETNKDKKHSNHDYFSEFSSAYTPCYLPSCRIGYFLDHGRSTFIKGYQSIRFGLRNKYDLGKFNPLNLFYANINTLVSRIAIKDSNLVIYNIHLPAFTKKTRILQLQFILKSAKVEMASGNEVILAGDFNMDLRQNKDFDLNDFEIYFPDSPTLKTKETIKTIDGFLVSKNVEVNNLENINNFDYSDHSAVSLDFKSR